MPDTFKIAIADDYPLVVKGLKELLEENGFDVPIEAGNGKDLIYQIENAAYIPDVCILDGNMPEMNGCETTGVLKTKWPSVRVIAFSMDSDIGEEMIKKGATAFVLKTSSPEMIFEAINKALEGR